MSLLTLLTTLTPPRLQLIKKLSTMMIHESSDLDKESGGDFLDTNEAAVKPSIVKSLLAS